MPRRSILFLTSFLMGTCLYPLTTLAADFELLAEHDGGGGYLSWIKLLIVVVTFVVWVLIADWVNRDTMKIGEETGMTPEIWNAVNVLSFLIGFFCAISIPLFYMAGLPVFALATFAPPVIYWLMRRGAIKADPGLLDKIKAKPGEKPKMRALPQDEGADVTFTPAGADKNQQQSNLIRARQAPTFLQLKEMVESSVASRAEQILIDYTRDAVAGRVQIDGMWHPLPAMDRGTGDSILYSLKMLAGLNPQDRRSTQQGSFQAKTGGEKVSLRLITQGTNTGERVQLKFDGKAKSSFGINQQGMLPEISQRLKTALSAPGLVIVSAPPGAGLSTSWLGVLDLMDRITRDCVALIDENESETNYENITPHTFSKAAGESPETILRRVLLAQPDCLVVPDIPDAENLDTLIEEANDESRSIVTRIQSGTAAEALLRLYAMSKKRREFGQAVQAVTGQRLLRRLCDKCKVEVQVQPQIIQQLGGDPRQQNTIFNPYRLPPPEQQVDENGKPIEMKPCATCNGIGYIGRVAAFETLFVSDAIRETLRTNPKVDAIEKAAQSEGKLSIKAQGYQLVLLGVTSIAEVQRVMKS